MIGMEQEAIEQLTEVTQALKNIINAAHNGEAYTPAELDHLYSVILGDAVDCLQRNHVTLS